MRKLLGIILLAIPVYGANNCVLNANGVKLSTMVSGNWTACGGTTPVNGTDNITLGAHTLEADINWTFGNSAGVSYLSYVSSIAVTDSTDTTCTSSTTAAMTGGTVINSGTKFTPSVRITGNGTVATGAIMVATNANQPNRMWLSHTSGPGSPTVGSVPAACSGATYTVTTVNGSTGVPAITWNSSSSAIQIDTGVTVTLAGAGLFSAGGANGKIVQKHGSQFNIDNSGASNLGDGTKPIYALTFPEATAGNTVVFDTTDCTLAAPCIIDGNPNATNTPNPLFESSGIGGTFNVIGSSGSCGNSPCITGVVQWKNLGGGGGGIDPAIDMYSSVVTSKFQLGLGSTCSKCGVFIIGQNSGAAEIAWSMTHTSPAGFSDVLMNGTTALSTGHRLVSNSVFNAYANDGAFDAANSSGGLHNGGACGGQGNMPGITFQNNYLADNWCSSSGKYGGFTGDLLILTGTTAAPAMPTGLTQSGTDMSNCYIFLNASINNPHFMVDQVSNISVAISQSIYDIAEDISANDASYADSGNSGNTGNWAIRNSIVIPSKQNHGQGWLLPDDSSGGFPNAGVTVELTHDVWISGTTGSSGHGTLMMLDHAANHNVETATVKSNIIVGQTGTNSPCSGDPCAFKVQSICPSCTSAQRHLDVCGALGVQCDYNAGFRISLTDSRATGCNGTTNCPNSGNGYAARFSNGGTPGTHDIDVVLGLGAAGINPRYVADPTSSVYVRSLATWDTTYLGNTAAAWSSGGTYATGDFVTDHRSGVYNNAVIRYRCINTTNCNGSNANSEPDNGSAWRTYWEYATLYDMRTAMAAGTTYTDGSINCVACQPITALVSWVVGGYVTQQPALWLAGSDKHDVGAADLQMVQHIPPTIMNW